MSQLFPIEQNSYNQGMILGVRQDAAFEKNELTSVAWLENLDPNVIVAEVVTRGAQGQEINNTHAVESTMGGSIISALEMTHGASLVEDKSTLHVFHTGEPSIRTSNEDRSDFNDGVWSNGDDFDFPVADYDVYGEAVLLCSDGVDVLDDPKRRPVYAYVYKDYDTYYGQKNESGKDLFVYGITPKPNAGVKRWEVLNETDLEKIIQIEWNTEDVPDTEKAKYLTAEAPLINGKLVGITGAKTANTIQPGGEIYDIAPITTSYKIKAGSQAVTITSYGWGYDQIDATQRADPSFVVGVGLNYDHSDRVVQELVPIWGSAPAQRTKYTPPSDPLASYYTPPGPEYTPSSLAKLFPVIWEVIDYVDAKKPRNFYVGERIPYVVTAIINGIEKIIKKDVFVVHSNKEIGIGVISTFTKREVVNPPDGLNPGNTFDEGSQDDFIAQRTASKRVHFNIKIDAAMKDIPIGLTEVRLYISNKNVGDRGMWNYVYPNLPSLSETLADDGYSGWVTLPESLYLNPDSDRESFSYSLAKSFVVFGDPDLYKRRNVETDHSNWGVNNIKVNDWIMDGIGVKGKDNGGSGTYSEFYVWDYMDRTAEPLATNLQSALFLWKGKGAKVLASMKGVTFIGGCMDSLGVVEAGLIRKSLLQGAVQSTDTFTETDFIKVGNETHTALIEFRGQLWAFSRTQMHRIQMRDMSDLGTVEVLEVLEGNGTFSPKTVIATPFGVAWLNEAGVWLSNGGEPTLLSKEIEPLYLSMARGFKNWVASNGDELDWQVTGSLYNKWMQVVYDNGKYDIVISCKAIRKPNLIAPTGEDDLYLDFRLIYNMVYKNWRVESYPLNLGGEDTITSFGLIHRTHWSFSKYKSIGVNPATGGGAFRVNTLAPQYAKDFDTLLIANRLVMHEIGNGVDDMQANSVTTEAAYLLDSPVTLPKFTINTGESSGQFQFPGTQNVPSSINEGELVAYHISNFAAPYWTENKVDTPIETPSETTSIHNKPIPLKATYNMTSQLHRVPFMKPVRRFVAEYYVKGNVRLRSIRMMLRVFTRKFWG